MVQAYNVTMTLSVCMIVKDEEQTLARALESVKPFADEIIVVDTGSTDSSVQIAKQFTENVFYFEWCDDFARARNFSFSKATCDLVMWLDADDQITADNAELFLQLKSRTDFDTAMAKYATAFDGEKPTFVYYRERVFRRELNPVWVGEVHEVIAPIGRVIYTPACVYHKKIKVNPTARNLHIYQKKVSKGEKLDARQTFYYGRELYFNGLYSECVAVLKDFLKGEYWVENGVEACRTLCRALTALGRREEGITALLQAFTLSTPRAEDCCILASYLEDKGCLQSAIFWYKRALESEENIESGAFVNTDYLTFIPAIRLCVIYDRLGNLPLAEQYNELAGRVKPNDQSYLHNRGYFQEKRLHGAQFTQKDDSGNGDTCA